MLSIGAFNALLKTLEEPPSHAIFILATTEIQKVPSTILSRCQTLEFKKISPIDMKNRIAYICELEKIDIDDSAIDEIINISDGCMRDALSFLEKINAFCNGMIRMEDVRIVSGKISKQFIQNLLEIFINKDINKSVEKINEAFLNDYDLLYVVEDIINELEDIIFKKNIKDEKYREILSKMIEIYDKMKTSSVSNKIIFEIGILDYCKKNNDEIISREIIFNQNNLTIEKNNQQKNEKSVEKQDLFKEKVADFDDGKFKRIRINNTFAGANKECLTIVKNKWEKLRDYSFDKESGALICNLLDGIPVAASNEYMIISYQYATETSKVNENYLKLQGIIKKYLLLEYNIVAISNDEWKQSRQEYVSKINSQEKYELIIDDFNNQEKQSIENKKTTTMEFNDSKFIDDKMLELFDSEDIEIK